MHANTDPSTAGLLLSLASAIPGTALARRARRTADALSHGASTTAQRHAADLLADLLTATDPELAYPEDGVLDEDFDVLG